MPRQIDQALGWCVECQAFGFHRVDCPKRKVPKEQKQPTATPKQVDEDTRDEQE